MQIRSKEECEKIINLYKTNISIKEIGIKLNIPYNTIKTIIFRYNHNPNYLEKRKCPILSIDLNSPSEEWKRNYSYILGQYLGDGHIISTKTLKDNSQVFILRIFSDAKYPKIITDIRYGLSTIFPSNKISKGYDKKSLG